MIRIMSGTILYAGLGKLTEDDIRELFHHRPTESDLIRKILGAEDHSLREHFMVPLVDIFHVVVTNHIKAVCKRLGHSLPERCFHPVAGILRLVLPYGKRIVQSAPKGTDTVTHRSCAVERAYPFGNLGCLSVTVSESGAFGDFIARRP